MLLLVLCSIPPEASPKASINYTILEAVREISKLL